MEPKKPFQLAAGETAPAGHNPMASCHAPGAGDTRGKVVHAVQMRAVNVGNDFALPQIPLSLNLQALDQLLDVVPGCGLVGRRKPLGTVIGLDLVQDLHDRHFVAIGWPLKGSRRGVLVDGDQEEALPVLRLTGADGSRCLSDCVGHRLGLKLGQLFAEPGPAPCRGSGR